MPVTEIDTNPEKYYRHTIGMDGIYAENFNFAVRHKITKQYSDVGNFIIYKNIDTKEPLFIEVGFGDTVIIQPKYGLNHIMDVYPFPKLDYLEKDYKLKDCIITSLALCREGLEPSNKNNQAKILYKYLRAMYYFMGQHSLSAKQIEDLLCLSETNIFGNIDSSKKIMNIFEQNKSSIIEINKQMVSKTRI